MTKVMPILGMYKSPSTSNQKLLACVISLVLSAGNSYAQDSLAVQKLGHLPYPNWELNDVWGYADTLGNEYALVGVRDGFNVVDVTNPQALNPKIYIYGAFSLWRDLKTWSHYAYVVHDYQFSWSTSPNEGVTIVDLDSLQNPYFKRFRPQFTINGSVDSLQRAHNIYIDENGVLYVFGHNLYTGGVLMFDVATDPWNPMYLGKYENFYLHDGYVRDNILYGAAVNNGLLCVVDVSFKASPLLLGTKATPNGTSHNTWLSDDGNTVFTTDEVPGGYIAAYDVRNPNNITELDKIRALSGTNVIPHNVHVYNDFLVTSYYTRGCHIVDAKYPDLLVEVGYYDTSPTFSGQGYNGAWGAYPYLPSGNILITDIQEGLFVLSAEYNPAARYYGIVVDSLTGKAISGANVSLAIRNFNQISSVDGVFKAGTISPGPDVFFATSFGYFPQVANVNFVAGSYDTVRIAMLPIDFGIDENSFSGADLYPNPSHNHFSLNFDQAHLGDEVDVAIYDTQGGLLRLDVLSANTEVAVEHNLPSGMYIVEVTLAGTVQRIKLLVE